MYLQNCLSSREFIAHCFICVYYPLYIMNEGDNFNLIDLIDNEFMNIQESWKLNPNYNFNPVFFSKQAKSLVNQIGCFIKQIFFYKNSNYNSDIIKSIQGLLFNNESACEKVGRDFLKYIDIIKHIKPIFRLIKPRLNLNYMIFPIERKIAGSLTLFQNRLPLKVKHRIGLHVNTKDSKDQYIKYHHFYGLRGAIIHELLSHCALSGLINKTRKKAIIKKIEDCQYISHGWLSFYAYLASIIIYSDDCGCLIDIELESKYLQKYLSWLIKIMKVDRNKNGIEGFEHAQLFYKKITKGEFMVELFEQNKDAVEIFQIHQSPDYKAYYFFQCLLASIIKECIIKKNIDNAVFILKNFYKLLRKENLMDKNSILRIALFEFFRDNTYNLGNIIKVFQEYNEC